MSGYFGIAVYHPKNEVNIGTLWRTAYIYNAMFIATIGRRYEPQSSDTTNTDKHIPLYEYDNFNDFLSHRPFNCPLVAVEQYGESLKDFLHPDRAIYILGAEDHGLPKDVINKCQYYIEITTPKKISLNIATAGALVIESRYNQKG